MPHCLPIAVLLSVLPARADSTDDILSGGDGVDVLGGPSGPGDDWYDDGATE